ncbi:peptidoglycan DD-metalloendopeptidase family protein [Paenarthrobacter sp. YJN-5]|uniref:peptidoglycan DD-metalloendopeptidase family protein n=1 Tax=Paenarthrobacter sp. YJN-5 TaxID=2735316 RepID=UPI001878A7BD|nr:peptidoglycan DD-metalloendopeptidase family protein [Paenarthrobacter sp. YJN-5]QOT19738.1 peptidoglycan DD-metalloendopeptidase family protein [Paenarthrobacter sp. YJN-5]
MASELASMFVSITPNMSGFRTSVLKELRGVDSDAAGAGSSSGSAFSGAFGKAIGGIGSALATALKVGTGAALAGIGAAGAVGIKTAAQLETANIGFTTMLGSGEKAQAFLKDLTDFAAKTPFELPGLQKSASQLVATGIATEKVIPIMTTLGNITSGMGTGSEGIQRAVVAIQQMNAAQKIGAEDLNQLRDAGVPVYELLAKATGKSTKEVSALAQAGKLGKKELDQLMATLESGVGLERFNGLMEAQSQSLTGLASTAKDTFQIGMAGAIAPLIPLLKDGLGGAITWMSDTLMPGIQHGLQETIGSVMSFGAAWRTNDGDITSSGMPGFFEQLGYWSHQAFDGLAGVLTPLRPIWDAFVSAGRELLPIFQPLAPQVVAVVQAFSPFHIVMQALLGVLPNLAPIVVTLAEGFANLVSGGLAVVLPVAREFGNFTRDVIVPAVSGLTGYLAENKDVTLLLAAAIGGIVVGIKLYHATLAVVASVTAAYRAGVALLTAVQVGHNAALGISTALTQAQAAATAKGTVGFVAMKVAQIGTTIATQTAAAAQWLWNAALSANPISLIIIAIAALVAGLIWFFTQTELGREIWANVWGFIQTLVAGFVDWWTNTFVPALNVGVQAVGSFFTWLWENGIKPPVDAIGTIITWLWQTIIVPAFQAWTTIIGGFIAFFQAIGEIIVAVIQQWIGPMFVWLWEQVIVPAWNGIMAIIGAAWDWINTNVFIPIGIAIDVMGQAWNWYWNQVIVPVWNGIMSAIGAAWNWIDTNVFKPIGVGVDLLGRGFSIFWHDVVEPVWQGIQDAIGGVWNWIRDNVFTPITDFVQKTIPTAFEAGKDAIGRAWDLIAGIVKKPIEFVVNTIINDGIIGAINTVRGWFQLEPLGKVALPAGWGSYAVGGYTGEGGKYQPAGIVHAGEVVWSQEDIARWGGVSVVEALRNAKGYAGGGLVSPLAQFVISQGFSGINGHNGIDMAAPTGAPIHAAGPGVISFAGWSGYGGGNETHIDHPNGLQTWYAHQSGFAVSGGSVAQGQTIGYVGATGLATGPHLHYMVLDGGWPNVLDPTPYLTGGGAPGTGQGGGFINPLAGLLDGFLNSVKGAFPDAGPMLEVAVGAVKMVFDDAMKYVTELFTGRTDPQGPKGRTAAAPYTLYDGGGWLPSMAEPQLVQHRKQSPDAVLTDRQWDAVYSTSQAVQGGGGAPTADALREVLEGAQLELVGVNTLTNAVAARIRFERSRRL